MKSNKKELVFAYLQQDNTLHPATIADKLREEHGVQLISGHLYSYRKEYFRSIGQEAPALPRARD